MSITEEILARFARHGEEAYFGEPVSQSQHALQAAYLAERDNAPDYLVVASLLHDIGHLLQDLPEDIADRGVDARHEDLGDAYLARHFPARVTEPVRLHVAAKRYLCSVEPEYLASLSPASLKSLELQGGPFTAAEAREFELNPHYSDAVLLRRCDDGAKLPDWKVPGLEHYCARLDAEAIKS